MNKEHHFSSPGSPREMKTGPDLVEQKNHVYFPGHIAGQVSQGHLSGFSLVEGSFEGDTVENTYQWFSARVLLFSVRGR